jgi:Domain of unknown function (DUF6430)
MRQAIERHWVSIVSSILAGMGVVFLFVESYEVVTNNDLDLSFCEFIILSIACGLAYFLVDGTFISGFLKKEIELPHHIFSGETVVVKFGDFFEEPGWKSLAVNDFFDDQVDDIIISRSSLHGKVIDRFWKDDIEDLRSQLDVNLREYKPRRSPRTVGKSLRYPIGSTAVVQKESERFILVALGDTDYKSQETVADSSDLIVAVRNLLKTARTVCSGETLIIPLLGSGLARVGIPDQAITHIILTAVFEESREAKVTERICLVLPYDRRSKINLLQIVQQWVQER